MQLAEPENNYYCALQGTICAVRDQFIGSKGYQLFYRLSNDLNSHIPQVYEQQNLFTGGL